MKVSKNHPTLGYKKVTGLMGSIGYCVNKKLVQRVRREEGGLSQGGFLGVCPTVEVASAPSGALHGPCARGGTSQSRLVLGLHSWRLSQIREDLGGSLIPISIFVTLCRPRHAFRPR